MIIKGWEAGEIEENKVTIILIIAALHKRLRADAKKGAGAGKQGTGSGRFGLTSLPPNPAPNSPLK